MKTVQTVQEEKSTRRKMPKRDSFSAPSAFAAVLDASQQSDAIRRMRVDIIPSKARKNSTHLSRFLPAMP
jgi:hypothetical protein